MAPSATKAGSVEAPVPLPQNVLVSPECCHVARTRSSSKGLGLKKWVMTYLSLSVNKVACGVKRIQAKPEVSGHIAVVGLGHGTQT